MDMEGLGLAWVTSGGHSRFCGTADISVTLPPKRTPNVLQFLYAQPYLPNTGQQCQRWQAASATAAQARAPLVLAPPCGHRQYL